MFNVWRGILDWTAVAEGMVSQDDTIPSATAVQPTIPLYGHREWSIVIIVLFYILMFTIWDHFHAFPKKSENRKLFPDTGSEVAESGTDVFVSSRPLKRYIITYTHCEISVFHLWRHQTGNDVIRYRWVVKYSPRAFHRYHVQYGLDTLRRWGPPV